MINAIQIPLINPNEPEALLADLHVEEGQQVAQGDLICTLETTKSTAEVEAETEGYVLGLRFSEGDTVQAGDVLAYLADSAQAEIPLGHTGEQPQTESAVVPEGLRITQPALNLAREKGIPLEKFEIGPLITEKTVREDVQGAAVSLSTPESDFDATALVIYGAGGHGKALLDLVRSLGMYRVVGFLDDGAEADTKVMGLPVLGGGDVLPELHAQGVRLAINAVGGIGNVAVRVKVFQRIADTGFSCPAVVHPTAFVEASAELAPGVQVFPHAYVGSEARVGFGSIVNTGAIVSHDCVLGNFVNISPGAILAGEVEVGDGALVGMGVTVNLAASIGAGARIGNSSTVKADLPAKGVVRAGTIWPK
jgi:acetyltransferase EpsM